MNETSWRHHYIPEFYLKGFTSISGKFKIYDVRKKQFKKDGQWFNPRSYFFEENANTLINSNEKGDLIEKRYSTIDDRIAKIFEKINKSTQKDKFGVSGDDIAQLQYFVSVMYRRIPTNYNEIKNIIKNKELKELGLIFKETKKPTISIEEMEEKIRQDENFFKMMKF